MLGTIGNRPTEDMGGGEWACSKCTLKNSAAHAVCGACGAAKPQQGRGGRAGGGGRGRGRGKVVSGNAVVKILALHGKRQCGEIFSQRLSTVAHKLRKHRELRWTRAGLNNPPPLPSF